MSGPFCRGLRGFKIWLRFEGFLRLRFSFGHNGPKADTDTPRSAPALRTLALKGAGRLWHLRVEGFGVYPKP